MVKKSSCKHFIGYNDDDYNRHYGVICRCKYKFCRQKNAKENASYKCLSLIILDSVMRVSRKYYPQTLLEECKYEMEKTKIESY